MSKDDRKRPAKREGIDGLPDTYNPMTGTAVLGQAIAKFWRGLNDDERLACLFTGMAFLFAYLAAIALVVISA